LQMFIKSINALAALVACMQPIFLLTSKHWSGGILIISSLLSLGLIGYYMLLENKSIKKWSNSEKLLVLAFFAPLISTFLAAIIRQDLYWAQFDSPARFALAAILYGTLRNTTIKPSNMLFVTIPIGIFVTFFYVTFDYGLIPSSMNRVTTHFMDPIMFGYICLSLGLLSFFMAVTLNSGNRVLRTLNFMAGLLGVYLSMLSQSRTGWFALPIIFIIYAFRYGKETSVGFKKITLSMISVCCAVVVLLSPTIQTRFSVISDEIGNYSFEGVAPDSSIGLRITFVRIAANMVSNRILSGYGDTARVTPDFPDEAKKYSSKYVQDILFKVGFHNEIVASGIHSGILGIASVLAVFFIPCYLFYVRILSALKLNDYSPLYGLIFVIVVFVSSLTIETFGLKFAASYYACMVAILAVDILKYSRIEKECL